MHLLNPYAEAGGEWLRGNLHTHSTNSDGALTPDEVAAAYATLGYDFLMFSDHDAFTDVAGVRDHGLVLLPGVELSAGPHLVHVGAKRLLENVADRQLAIDKVNAEGGFAIAAHPNWEHHFNHFPQHLLESLQGYIGLEIYNGVIRRLDGSPLATDRWDQLLGQGRRLWGFANDDHHTVGDAGLAWNMVRCAERTPEAIMAAMRRGAFYASTGVAIHEIGVEGRCLHVATDTAQRMVVHCDFGHHQYAVDGPAVTYTLPEDGNCRYLRVTCWGPRETMAWTQPFFVEKS